MLEQIRALAETKRSYVWGVIIKSKQNQHLYDWLMEATSHLPTETTITERVYVVLHPDENPICALGKKRRLDHKIMKYAFCGRIDKCPCWAAHHKETYQPPSEETMKSILEKRVKTWEKKYGTSNPSKSAVVKEKRKQTYAATCKKEVWKKLKADMTLAGYNQVIARVSEFVKPKFIAEEYRGCFRKNMYHWECVKCSREFHDHVDYGRVPKCVKCFPNQHSKVESVLREFIESLGVTAESNCREVLKNLEYDIWIPSRRIAIEYNGIYWHSDEWKTPDYHYEKFAKSRDQGVRLIQIFEDEWLTKPDIIKNRLMSLLGYGEKINARECTVVNLSGEEYKQFVETYHLQGYASASIKLGLIHKDCIVAVMSFATSRYSTEGYELIRYCSKGIVRGGASKLFKHFVRMHSPTKVISYANRCWSNGNLYEKLGFKNITKKDKNMGYWYVKKKTRYHRSTFTKKRLKELGFDSSKTEAEIMRENGFLKIYDAGNYKYEWVPNKYP